MARQMVGALLLVAVALSTAGPPAVGQDKKAPAGDLVPVAEILQPLVDALKLKNEPNSIAALEKAIVGVKEEARPPKERMQILKVMASGIDNKNDKVKIAAANALGRVGQPATKMLLKALTSKKVRKNPPVYAAVIDAVGLTRDEKYAVTALLKIIKGDKDWRARAWAAKALGNYGPRHARGKTRKKICERLIQIYEGIQSAASDGKNTDARNKLNTIQSDFVTTLRTLTEAEWQSALDWRRWFNKEKRKRWSNPKKKKPKKKK